jgi:hypothetical protein
MGLACQRRLVKYPLVPTPHGLAIINLAFEENHYDTYAEKRHFRHV